MSRDLLIDPVVDDERFDRDQAGSDHLLEPAPPLFPTRSFASGQKITTSSLVQSSRVRALELWCGWDVVPFRKEGP